MSQLQALLHTDNITLRRALFWPTTKRHEQIRKQIEKKFGEPIRELVKCQRIERLISRNRRLKQDEVY